MRHARYPNVATPTYPERYGKTALEGRLVHDALETYLKLGEQLAGYVTDTAALLNRAIDRGASVLFEGAQGTMLDIDHGTYPYVTSSSATAGGCSTGLGVPPTRVRGVVGVTKAYTTRVGSGPFPTEMPDLEATEVRDRGREFGAVTGRPRRCGWLDLEVLRYAKMINGIDSKGGQVIVNADVPLAEMFGYATAIRSLSKGRASYSMEPLTFQQVPSSILAAILDEAGKKPAARA